MRASAGLMLWVAIVFLVGAGILAVSTGPSTTAKAAAAVITGVIGGYLIGASRETALTFCAFCWSEFGVEVLATGIDEETHQPMCRICLGAPTIEELTKGA